MGKTSFSAFFIIMGEMGNGLPIMGRIQERQKSATHTLSINADGDATIDFEIKHTSKSHLKGSNSVETPPELVVRVKQSYLIPLALLVFLCYSSYTDTRIREQTCSNSAGEGNRKDYGKGASSKARTQLDVRKSE